MNSYKLYLLIPVIFYVITAVLVLTHQNMWAMYLMSCGMLIGSILRLFKK